MTVISMSVAMIAKVQGDYKIIQINTKLIRKFDSKFVEVFVDFQDLLMVKPMFLLTEIVK